MCLLVRFIIFLVAVEFIEGLSEISQAAAGEWSLGPKTHRGFFIAGMQTFLW